MDELPKTVCDICVDQINNWYKFKEMVIDSQQILKNQLLNQQRMITDDLTNADIEIHCAEEMENDIIKDEWKKEIEDELFSDFEESIEDIDKLDEVSML